MWDEAKAGLRRFMPSLIIKKKFSQSTQIPLQMMSKMCHADQSFLFIKSNKDTKIECHFDVNKHYVCVKQLA